MKACSRHIALALCFCLPFSLYPTRPVMASQTLLAGTVVNVSVHLLTVALHSMQNMSREDFYNLAAETVVALYNKIQALGDSVTEEELKAQAKVLMSLFLQAKGENALAARILQSMDELGGSEAIGVIRDKAKTLMQGNIGQTFTDLLAAGTGRPLSEELERFVLRTDKPASSASAPEKTTEQATEQTTRDGFGASMKNLAGDLWNKGRDLTGMAAGGTGSVSLETFAVQLQAFVAKGKAFLPESLSSLNAEGVQRVLQTLNAYSGNGETALMEQILTAGSARLHALQESLTLELQTLSSLYAGIGTLEKFGIGTEYRAMLAKCLVALQAGIMGDMAKGEAIYTEMQAMGDSEAAQKERCAALNWLGIGYIQAGDFKKAEEIYRRLPSAGSETFTGPATAQLANSLVNGYLDANKVEEAVAVFRTFPALKDQQANLERRADVAENLVFLLLLLKENEKAQAVYEEFRQGKRQVPNARVAVSLIQGLVDSGQLDKAAAIYATLVHGSGDPYACKAAAYLVSGHLKMNNLPRAEDVYRSVVPENMCTSGQACRSQIRDMEAMLMEGVLTTDDTQKAEALYMAQMTRNGACDEKPCKSLQKMVGTFVREGRLKTVFSLIMQDTRPVDQAALCLQMYYELVAACVAAKITDNALEAYKAMPEPTTSMEANLKGAAVLLILPELRTETDREFLEKEKFRLKKLESDFTAEEARWNSLRSGSSSGGWFDN